MSYPRPMRSARRTCELLVIAALGFALFVATVRAAPDPGEVDALIADGHRARKEQDFGAARAFFERAIALDPERSEAHLGLGDALVWLGSYREALSSFEQALRLSPDSALAHLGIGHAYLQIAQHSYERPRSRETLLDRVEAEFRQARRLAPGHELPETALQYLALARDGRGRPLSLLEWLVLPLLLALAVVCGRSLWRSRPWRPRDLAWPLGAFMLTRGLVLAAFALSPLLLPEAGEHPLKLLTHPAFALDTIAGRWDANLYALLAFDGYAPAAGQGLWGTVGEFPLLPILFRWLAYALDDVHLAALLLTHGALLLAVLLSFRWFEQRYPRRLAVAATVALLVHPGSLFGSVLYAEPLALLGLAGLARGVQRRAWLEAGLWGMFAGLARINSVAILPWLLLEWWRERSSRSWPSLAACLMPLCGVAAFMLYLQLELGDPLAYFHELRNARFADGAILPGLSEAVGLIVHLVRPTTPLIGGPLPVLLLALACLVAYALAALWLYRRREFGPALFVATGMLLGLSSSLAAQPRYLWLLFPALACFGSVCDRPVVRVLSPLVSAALLCAAAVGFARWYYVT